MKLLLLTIFLFLLPSTAANLLITEIFPDPIADETLNEWLEIYNNGSAAINLSLYSIGDDNSIDTLTGAFYGGQGTLLQPNQYAIITDDNTRVYENFNVSESALHIYVDDAAIGNGLSNSGETIYLYQDNNIIHQVTYQDVEEGKSYTKVGENYLWQEPTPGYSITDNDQATIDDYSCDWNISIIINQTSFASQDDFSFKIKAVKETGVSTNLTATAAILDMNNNPIKNYNPFTNHSAVTQKTSTTYTPNLAENNIYLLTADLNVTCNETNLANNHQELFFAIASTTQIQNTSSLHIEEVLDLENNKAMFGDTLRVKILAYKGDTSKYAMKTKIKNDDDTISETTTTYLYSKYTNYTLTIPISIKPNCNLKYDDGKYNIEIEGLDHKVTKEIEVEDIDEDFCETKIIYAGEQIQGSGYSYEILDLPEIVSINENFDAIIKIANNDDKDHDFKVSSYIYRGPKQYSEKGENEKEVDIDRYDDRKITLKNKAEDIEPGLYKIKFLIKKDKQKTPKEIIRQINFINPDFSENKITIEAIETDTEQNTLTTSIKNDNQETVVLTATLSTFTSTQTANLTLKPKAKKTIAFEIEPEEGKNIYFLDLKKEDNLIDMKKVEFNYNPLEFIDTLNPLTGNYIHYLKKPSLIYESPSEKSKKLIPYFIASLALISALLFLIKEK